MVVLGVTEFAPHHIRSQKTPGPELLKAPKPQLSSQLQALHIPEGPYILGLGFRGLGFRV